MAGSPSTNTSRLSRNKKVGVLALQGDYVMHQQMLAQLGVVSIQVRKASQLESLGALIIPGGESTTMLKLISEEGLLNPLKKFHETGGAFYGTCAGAILLARKVTKPEQSSIGMIDIDIARNGYGRQIDSHKSFEICEEFPEDPLPMMFIRAPVIVRIGPNVSSLASHRGKPVLVQQDKVLASTFHPELSHDSRVHEYFLEKVAQAHFF